MLFEEFSLRNLIYIETDVINPQRLPIQVTIADVNYYSASRTPADFKTILHVKFPTSKSRQIGSRLLDRVKWSTFSGRPENYKGATFVEIEMKMFQSWFWISSPNSQHYSLQVTIADVNYYSALRTPADFKTILHIKIPHFKIPSNWLHTFGTNENDQHSWGDQKMIKGATFAEIEKRIQSWFWMTIA